MCTGDVRLQHAGLVNTEEIIKAFSVLLCKPWCWFAFAGGMKEAGETLKDSVVTLCCNLRICVLAFPCLAARKRPTSFGE